MPDIVNITFENDGERIDKTLAAIFPDMTRSFFQKLLDNGAVTVNGKVVNKKYTVRCGEQCSITFPDPEPLETLPEDIPLDIFYEDSDLLVVNKKKGMVVHPSAGHYSGTLVNALLYYCGDTLSGINGVIRPGIVHRLDMDTSGLIIVAKNDYIHNKLAELIKVHDFTRQYEAVVVGCPKKQNGTVNAPIGRSSSDRKKMAVLRDGGRDAVTHYELLAKYKGFSHLRLMLETGRTHQIRVHMAHIGHPVVCDEVYGGKPQFQECKGQCLHAKKIAFVHPRTGKLLDLEAPLPDYFTKVLKKLTPDEDSMSEGFCGDYPC